MKKIYNFVYALDNKNLENNGFIDIFELMKAESHAFEFLNKVEFSPGKKVVNNILQFAKNSVKV